ncbi:SRPBCC family protein [Chitinophaga pinensis]|uniref:Cyclase/dehydrase n=1 Tax=Chitinophaga pinensis (strain ATCC 43595 / DSM 2588 / LMG 13176 / NBRC 15968 / NCIMB 11800 / UQM 2034) TaxID=485918 RepID=A0A979GAA2_CHIPD|nr:SRPBCC family protein [Chitinophaga pinensis]ACU63688.1 cyclase/dehydrase [Chitinophaga pinensis DSM 2588]
MNTYRSLNGHGEPRATWLYEQSNVLNVSRQGRIASVVGGALLTASGINNITKHPFRSLLRLIAGGYLLYRGISGNCPVSAYAGRRMSDRHNSTVNVRAKFIVDKPRDEVYAFWRRLENLPHFMRHLASITEHDDYHSHWIVKGPGGIGTLEWDAEIIKDEEGALIGWRSAPGSNIATAGKVTFSDALDGGTEIEVVIAYRPPAGYVGTGLAWLLNSAFHRMVEKDVMRFKHYVETGEITA